MPSPPPREKGPKVRPGLIGLVRDRQDLIAKAWKSYIREAERRRNSYNTVLRDDGEVKYETWKRGPADTEAKKAGKMEKIEVEVESNPTPPSRHHTHYNMAASTPLAKALTASFFWSAQKLPSRKVFTWEWEDFSKARMMEAVC
jgi:hypothetical protein